MKGGWVAAAVRARGLARRRLGIERIRAVATSGSLAEAVAIVSASPYGREVQPGLALADAGRGVLRVLLWHLRVLAGWGPPMSAGTMRALAAGFEMTDILEHLDRLEGRPAPEPFRMGSLATAWSSLSQTTSPAALRQALAVSEWGDPGAEDRAVVRLGLELAWARRVHEAVPCASRWAVGAGALAVAKVVASGVVDSVGPSVRRDASRLLGPQWQRARSLAELASVLPPRVRPALREVEDDQGLWRAELRWWSEIGRSAARLAAGPAREESVCVGVAGLLGADAWRTRAALELAARGGGNGELVDALG